MYRYKNDTYDTLEKLTGGGELSDHSACKSEDNSRDGS